MLTKKQKLTLLGVVLLCLQPVLLTGAATLVSAEVVEQTQELQDPEVVEVDSPELFEAVQENTDEILKEETSVVDDGEITMLVDKNEAVKATEIINDESNEQIVITNTGDNVIIEITTTDASGNQETIQEIYPIVKENVGDDLIKNKLVYGGWTYTGFAVGRNAFAALAGLGIGKIVGAFAAIFGISGSAASFCVNYMGIKGGFTAGDLASHLDTNGNGWIALYKRTLQYYKGGKLIGYQHRTY